MMSSKHTDSLRRRRGKPLTDPHQNNAQPNDKVERVLHFSTAQPKPNGDPAAKGAKPHPSKTSQQPPLAFTVYQNSVDWLIMTVLLIVAASVRFYRIAYPDEVIFDEVHYLGFTNNILNRKYLFDVNPVWGKLVIAFVAKLMGYDPTPVQLTLGQRLASPYQALAVRVPCAIFGTLTVPVFYKVCRWLHLSTYASVIGSAFIAFDCMHVIQSRVAMVDAILVFWTCFSMMCALTMWDQKNRIVFLRKELNFSSVVRMMALLIVTGINCGLSVSVRWTAFATPVLIFVISFFGVAPFLVEPFNFIELFVLYGSAFVGYCGSFVLFLLQVSNSGPGDNFMSPEFQACINGNQFATSPEACTKSWLARVWEVNKVIFDYSKSIRGKDKWGSSWFQWIINWRGALYHRTVDKESKSLGLIYVLMNPFMTLMIDLLMCVFIAALFYIVRYRKQVAMNAALKAHLRRGSVLFFGWVCSMLPTMVVYRSGPVYQYLPGLFFAQAMAAVGFDLIPRKMRPVAAVFVLAGLVGSFVYWSPWVYGNILTDEEHARMRWLPRWD